MELSEPIAISKRATFQNRLVATVIKNYMERMSHVNNFFVSDAELRARRRPRRRGWRGPGRPLAPRCLGAGRAEGLLQRPSPREEGVELAPELAKEGGHFSLLLASPAPSWAPLPPAPHPT